MYEREKNNFDLEVAMKAKKIIILFVCFLLAGMVFLTAQQRYMLDDGQTTRFKLAKQSYERGKQLLVKKSYDRAEKAFKECLETFPKFSYADYFLGKLHYQKKKYVKALEHIEKAKENYKFISKFWLNTQLQYLSILRQQKSNMEEQVRDLEQLLVTKNYRGSDNRETAYAKEQEMKRHINTAKSDLQQVNDKIRTTVPQTPQMVAEYHFLHGNVLFKLKRYNDAYAEFIDAVKIRPDYGDAYINLANLNYMGRRYNEALLYLQKAEQYGAEMNPNFKKALLEALGK